MKSCNTICGDASIYFANPPKIEAVANVGGKKEGEGPLAKYFDEILTDDLCGQKSWEQAESILQSKALTRLLIKSGCDPQDLRYLFAGDLENQMTATSFGLKDTKRPLFGVYGACSTMGETLILGAMTVAAGYAPRVACVTSSHFASAERAFRFPLAYANQRPFCATWTVTGAGAVLLGSKGNVAVVGVTPGQVVDYGIKDSNNMGAAMAPAAAHTIQQALHDFQMQPEDFDRIITGDLGVVGQRALFSLMDDYGFDIRKQHMDCGMEIFDSETQDTHAGGSGCGCAATTLCGLIMNKLEKGSWKRVLFVPTGALLSQTSFHEAMTIPGIAHGVILERK